MRVRSDSLYDARVRERGEKRREEEMRRRGYEMLDVHCITHARSIVTSADYRLALKQIRLSPLTRLSIKASN